MSDQALLPWRLGYVSLGVADLDAAVGYWTKFGGLSVSERTDEEVYLRGGVDHHWLVLSRAENPGIRRLAFEVATPEDLGRFGDKLTAAGITVTQHDGAWSGDALRCKDPDGYEVELFTGMGNVPVPPAPRGWFAPKELLHAVVAVGDLEASYEFYAGLLGFRESDRVIDRTVFLRAGIGYHHALVIGTGRGEPHLDHVCFLMPDFDDLMRARAFFIEEGQPFDRDILRHPTSGSMGFYAKAVPEPTTLEMCVDHAIITDPDHRPRSLTVSRWTSNVWLPPKS
jgi:2,3-dihydroxy-p-cumate/2,3-dihydroxybenzoate 3,4-dioxygenase